MKSRNKKYKLKLGSVKFLSRPNKHEYYVVEWKTGYVEGWQEWGQINYKRFNWLTFVLAEFEIERQLGQGVTVNLGLLGFRLRIHSLFRDSEFFKKLQKDAEDARTAKAKGIPFDCVLDKHKTLTASTQSPDITCADCHEVLGKVTQ